MKSSLAKNAIYKVILNVFNLLVPLFVGPYVAGLLTPELYGVYNRVYAEFQVFFIVGAFGIYNYGVREISKVRNDKKRFGSIFTSLFVIGILSNLLVTIFYIGYIILRGNGIDQYVYLVMIIQMVSNVFYIEFVNEAVENYRFIAIKTILIRILYLISIFAFVRKPTDVIIYSVVVSMTVLLNNLASFFYLKRQYKFDFTNVKILCHIMPLIVNLIFTNVELLYGQLDKVLLGAFVSDIAVTEYTLPTTLAGMLSTIPLSLITVAIPRLSKYIGENDRESYINTLKSTCRTYMAILIPMSFGVMVLAKEIMTYLVMYVNSMEKKLTVLLFQGGVINCILNFSLILVGNFSALSALITTMIAVLVFIFLSLRYAKNNLDLKGIFITKEIIGYFIIGICFIPISIGVNLLRLGYIWNIVIEIVLCVGLYGFYMIYTKDPLLDVVFRKFRM